MSLEKKLHLEKRRKRLLALEKKEANPDRRKKYRKEREEIEHILGKR